MRADEVALPFTHKDTNETVTTNDDSSIARPPESITVEELDKLLAEKPVTRVNGVRFIGTVPTDPGDVPLYFCCRCERFDLSSEADRNKYANLVAEANNTASLLDIGWEERVKEVDKLIIYMTYMEYVKIAERN